MFNIQLWHVALMPFIVLSVMMLFQYKKTILKREGKVYLVRRTLLSTKWFTVKIHKIFISDEAEPHDHPWHYMSVLLKGGYWEHRPRFTDNREFQWKKPGSILFRRGNDLHRLMLPHDSTATSIIFTTGKIRDWGFKRHNGAWEKYDPLKHENYYVNANLVKEKPKYPQNYWI